MRALDFDIQPVLNSLAIASRARAFNLLVDGTVLAKKIYTIIQLFRGNLLWSLLLALCGSPADLESPY